jgi:hypothetical protein
MGIVIIQVQKQNSIITTLQKSKSLCLMIVISYLRQLADLGRAINQFNRP